MSFSDGLTMSVGSSLYQPNNSNPAGPLPQARQAYILSSSDVCLVREMEKWKDELFFFLVVEKRGRIENIVYINLLLYLYGIEKRPTTQEKVGWTLIKTHDN